MDRSPVRVRSLVVAACAVVLSTAMLLPVSMVRFESSVAFMPAMVAVVTCFDVMSVYLLVGDYRDRGDPRLLMMAWAYAWSLPVMGGYALAFPGAVAVEGPLAVTPSVAPYLYIAWHCGFPVLLGAAWAAWPARWMAPIRAGRRRLVSAVSVAGAGLSGVGVVAAVVGFVDRLPVVINGADTSMMTVVTAPVAVPLVVAALAVAVYGARHRKGPERWVGVAVLVCLGDLVLTYVGGARYSVGWYGGRSLTLVAAAVLLLAMLAAVRRLKAQAERDATVDVLTGLSNRRSATEVLEQIAARCRRSGAELSVVSVDLDHFKKVNDEHGHPVGDAVLVETGRVLRESIRHGDVAARVGGEEFLILLPDTAGKGAVVVAEKIRAMVALMAVPGLPGWVTTSLGVATLRPGERSTVDLLRRADAALYHAKQNGRNRVAVNTGDVIFGVQPGPPQSLPQRPIPAAMPGAPRQPGTRR